MKIELSSLLVFHINSRNPALYHLVEFGGGACPGPWGGWKDIREHGVVQAASSLWSSRQFLRASVFSSLRGLDQNIALKNVWFCEIIHRMISVHFQGKPFSITVIQVYAPSSNAEKAEFEWFYEDLQELLEITPQKDVLFNIGDWNAKVGCQEIPGITGKFGLGVQNEAGQKLTEFCQENALVIANTFFQQHKRRFYTWTLPDGQY